MTVYYPLGRGEDMSEGEYQAMQAACDSAGAPPPRLDEPAGYWRTRNGSVIRVADMSSSHLLNAVRLFDRSGYGDLPKILELREELVRRLP